MDLLESTAMAVKTLKANKLRSALTMLGIIIGNASVITMVGVGQGAQRYASEQFESLGPNVLFVIPGSDSSRQRTLETPRTLTLEDAEAIASQVPTVIGVAPQLQTQQTVTQGNRSTSALIVGTTPEFSTVRSFPVARGRFLTDMDVQRGNRSVALGADLARSLFGDADPLGQTIRIKNLTFQVVGVMEAKGAFLGNNQDDVAYIPITTMSSQITGNSSPYGTEVTFISIMSRDEQSIGAAQFQVTNLLRLRHRIVSEDDFTVRSQKDALEIVGNVTGALTIMLAAIAGISLLVGGIGIMNIMLVSVRERTQEIGLRKAIGASQQDILVQFMIEATILAVLGGVAGTLIGIGGVSLAGALTPLKAGVSPTAILLAVGVSGGIGLFFGVVPARQAAKLDPIVALRSA
ncbi:FtsX-like permease family protein [Thermoleptolyngbya sichuanensis A183]|uniref:FtsX-like permease family protein n=1 Tax=Thermoleptolyngbya sichuanensis A183 TaxID=2737172 RepID=A0A6M8BL18_9CYAN|nr:ABC transporter permease [Thermoleptolyngbya sichuanensis]MDG2616504.1 ABC transporter permease [Thermoleptolyngbya sichuanensis XZ-Cy5]QKD83703.1 FtsX-like permease family protein [Thermoleptolyngbya sichuanensis A183]